MFLLTGGNGQLGTELRHLLDEKICNMFQQMQKTWISQMPRKQWLTSQN